ncbi:MAG TPA: 16S rRNA (adenine(1518)-N(6)/adenine(1519)-N(6))-dimethyltransferase RsmA [Candidatus Ruminococcus gallistercoris]|jgi:16S rRNA (adenine1518-N6/adenine1519-N6)-dimethyltransferase|nr:16S rRNA (adenine(1518)-N(6)/adenine(1519)-N(6))-dimethyltransferase RsmA [Candidatus Ruminococcus gallistercoris]
MQKLSDISTIRAVLEKNGFHFSKALGQNFLINPSVCPRMAALSGAADCAGAVEVGPGIGVLTWELSQVAKKVVSIELDKRLLPVLDETLADCDNVKILNADVMKLDLRRMIEEEFPGGEVAVCANLPYYITSPVIMRLLEERLPVTSITVMVQKEAAERLCAHPGERACGAVSAAVWYYAEPEILFQVSRGSFMPAPNVDSAVIRLRIRRTPPVEVADEPFFFRVVRAAFAQRRKTAVNSIANTLGRSKQAVAAAFDAAGVPQNARAEALTLEDFAALAAGLLQEK